MIDSLHYLFKLALGQASIWATRSQSKAQLLIYGLDFWQRQMRKKKTKCGRLSSVFFFWHDKYMCKSVQKSSEKKVFQLKMDTMTFQNGMKKKTVSVILLQFYFHSLVLTYVHDLLMQGFIHLKIGRFDLWWCGENLLSPEFFSITYIIIVVNVLDMIFFGLFLDEYKGRRFHAWQLVSAAVKSRLRSH